MLVTNGRFCLEPLDDLIPLIDAANIDLKGFTQNYYDWVGGDLETVKRFITRLTGNCHVEVTTLVVPDKNFKYPSEIRRIIYTTNAIEGFNRQLRKVTKAKPIFPTDDSLLKSCTLRRWTSRKSGPADGRIGA